MKHIEQGWQSFRRMAVPRTLPRAQQDRIREAYFAGAAVLFKSIIMSLDAGEEPTAADLARMSALQDEIDEFGQQLDAKYLQRGQRPH